MTKTLSISLEIVLFTLLIHFINSLPMIHKKNIIVTRTFNAIGMKYGSINYY